MKFWEGLTKNAAGIGLGLQGISMLMSGFGAMGNKGLVADAKTAAADMFQDQLNLLTRKKELTQEAAGQQFEAGGIDLSMGTKGAITQNIQGGDIAAAQTNLVTSTIDQKIKTSTENVLDRYKTDFKKLVDTRQMVSAESDLQFESGQMSAEERYQSELANLESIPTTFLEGLFG